MIGLLLPLIILIMILQHSSVGQTSGFIFNQPRVEIYLKDYLISPDIGRGQSHEVLIKWPERLPRRPACANSLALAIMQGSNKQRQVSRRISTRPLSGMMAGAGEDYLINLSLDPFFSAIQRRPKEKRFYLTIVSDKCKKIYGFSDDILLDYDGVLLLKKPPTYSSSRPVFNIHADARQ